MWGPCLLYRGAGRGGGNVNQAPGYMRSLSLVSQRHEVRRRDIHGHVWGITVVLGSL